MTRPLFRCVGSRFIPITAAFALLYLAFLLSAPPLLRAQTQALAPQISVDGECTAIAYAPDGRMAYSIKHVFPVLKLDVQRDDIWVMETDGRRHRIVNGERMARGDQAFSYTITGLRWSADSKRITADLSTSQLGAAGETLRDQMLLLLGSDGKEIRIAGGDNLVTGTVGGAWLGTEDTVAYLTETVQPKLMFSISMIQSPGGRVVHLFGRRPFAAVAWNPRLGKAVAIERDPTDAGDTRLVLLDLLQEDHQLLARLDDYSGSLSFSPSGDLVAFFHDYETLEVRQIAHPDQIARVHVAYGPIAWPPDEKRVLVKRGPDRQPGDLVWVPLPAFSAASENIPAAQPELMPLLGGAMFRESALSPDGKSAAVTTVENRKLEVFTLK